ncbi:hypothetical protein [Lysobacter sp. ESA13C]|nr:hypothetical protein [Lysobacter sp. ESA13C]
MNRYEVIDVRTQSRVGRVYTTRDGANRAADRLDLAYGAVRYVVRAVR